jgi:beta-lactam-binding protein with PASTA domain
MTEVPMPNVVGEQFDTGIESLQASGAYAPPKLSFFDTFPISVAWLASESEPGIILGQLPPANDLVVPNSAISLAVSRFPMAVSGFATPAIVPPIGPTPPVGAWTADSTAPTIDTTGTTIDE